jgi:hypothetical protein
MLSDAVTYCEDIFTIYLLGRLCKVSTFTFLQTEFYVTIYYIARAPGLV